MLVCLSRSTFTEKDAEILDDEKCFENRIFAVKGKDNGSWLERMWDMQNDNPAVKLAMQQLQSGNRIGEGRYKGFKLMHIDSRILMRVKQMVVPNNLRFEITNEFHDRALCLEWYAELFSDYCKQCSSIRNKAEKQKTHCNHTS